MRITNASDDNIQPDLCLTVSTVMEFDTYFGDMAISKEILKADRGTKLVVQFDDGYQWPKDYLYLYEVVGEDRTRYGLRYANKKWRK